MAWAGSGPGWPEHGGRRGPRRDPAHYLRRRPVVRGRRRPLGPGQGVRRGAPLSGGGWLPPRLAQDDLRAR
eukprot:12861324-Alexandrium_andersonii.AAC.1